jgi:hypothetical protein
MKKFTLYLGLNDKDSKIQKIDTIEAYKVVTNILMKYTSGATIYSAHGIYKHEDGSFVIENTLRIELLFVEKSTVLELIDILKHVFNQESIALQVENINSELI